MGIIDISQCSNFVVRVTGETKIALTGGESNNRLFLFYSRIVVTSTTTRPSMIYCYTTKTNPPLFDPLEFV